MRSGLPKWVPKEGTFFLNLFYWRLLWILSFSLKKIAQLHFSMGGKSSSVREDYPMQFFRNRKAAASVAHCWKGNTIPAAAAARKGGNVLYPIKGAVKGYVRACAWVCVCAASKFCSKRMEGVAPARNVALPAHYFTSFIALWQLLLLIPCWKKYRKERKH